MLAVGLPTSNFFASALSQTVAGFASRASSALKGFESDLNSGNAAGAQTFLSALQQKVTAQGAAPAGSTLATQFTQVSNDLQSGNFAAARTDFSGLQSGLAHLGHNAGRFTGGGILPETSATSNTGSNAALQSLNLLQQSAYNSALDLTLPASMPSLSVSSW